MISAIAVEELRVGMFIQLEGGWLSHPFPRSSFKITAPEQIEAVRKLGLRQVQWDSDKSDLPSAAAAPGAAVDSAAGAASDPSQASSPSAAAENGPVAFVDPGSQRLRLQREAAQLCERQHQEAQAELRRLIGCAATQPEQAGKGAQQLTQAMLDKMLDQDDVGIRLVSPGSDHEASHALNVGVISMLIGRAMGLPEAELLDIGVGGLMHDLGKAEMPHRLRRAVEGASSAEVQAYRDHVGHGVRLGQRMSLSNGALAVLAQHHEHADGSGFPARLSGDQIGLAARVVSVVNRYDGLVNPAGTAPGLTPHEAVALLFAQYRHRFDAAVLNAFIRMIGVYPAGCLVQLTDDRYALVIGSNSSRPLKPRVLVHDARVRKSDALLLDLEQERDLGIRRSLNAQRVPPEVLQYLDPQPRVSYYFEPLGARASGREATA